MQNAEGVKVMKAEDDLSRVSDGDGLGEGPVLLEKTGNGSARHPLDEQVDGVALLHGTKHPDDVSK